MKKIKLSIIIVLLILSSVIFITKTIPSKVSAFERVVTVTTETEFIEALSDLNDKSNVSITLSNNIDLTQKIDLYGQVEISGLDSVDINLLNSSYFDLKNGVNATFKNININKPSSNQEKQAILFRDNTNQGYVNFYNSNIIVDSGVALNSISINGRYYLDNTIISGGEISCTKGSIYLSGVSKFDSVGEDVLVYDFRECNIIATPNTTNFNTSDKVELSISQKPVFWKGSSDDIQKFNVNIYYTLDGSDPVTSSTRILYNKNEPISLIVDRKIKAVAICDEICYSIGIYEFNYDVNKDKTPSEITYATPCETISIKCQYNLSLKDLPEAVEITLLDGRSVHAITSWDISSVDITKEGTYRIYGDITAPYFISNPKNIKAQMDIEVYYDEINNFTFKANNPMQVGKNTNKKDYIVGEFSARGGDELNYEYSFDEGDGDYDNNKFYIEDNQLKLIEQLPAGTYSVRIKVKSAYKTDTITLNLEVLAMSYEKIVTLNPYEGIDWTKTNFVSSALHNHTWYSSKQFEESEHNDTASDTADERIAAYKALGFGAVIITEHDYVTLDKYNGKFSDDEILTIYGNEMSKKYHTLYYGLEPYYDMRGQGTSVTNGMEGNIQNIAAMNGNGIAYFAHPNRSTTDKDYWYNLFNKYDVIYGMEVFNAGQAIKNYSEDLWDYILTKSMPNRPIWGSASDDAHSNGAIATGWQVMLLSNDQMNAQGLFDCLKNGNSFLTTICINPETDDDIMYNDVIGDIPYFTSVVVNEEKNVITVTAQNYTKIEWVSANGEVVGTSATIDLNKTYGIDKYVRCRIYGDGGMSHTQPIGISNGENLYAGEMEETPTQPDVPTKPEQPTEPDVPTTPTQPTQPDVPSTPETPNNTQSEKKGCGGSIVTSIYSVLAICAITITLKKKKN